MKTILFPILFFSCITLFGQTEQDTIPKWFSFSTNVVQDAINECNLNLERGLSSRFCVGTDLGRIYYHDFFSVVFLSPSQNYWPGTVYHGYACRLYLKYYSLEKPARYASIQLLYKNESFNGISFEDAVPSRDEIYTIYTRSENTSVYGIDLLYGYEPEIEEQLLFFDLFFGIGIRDRDRNGTTLTVYDHGYSAYGSQGPVVGPYHINQFYPTIVFGMKFGFYFLSNNAHPSYHFQHKSDEE